VGVHEVRVADGRATPPSALILDFDGTMVDTEWPVFEMVMGVYRAHGAELVIADWVDKLGRGDHRPWHEELAEEIGREPDSDVVEKAVAAGRESRSMLPLLPGVTELMDAADRAGVPLAVASSSPSSWVDSHLERLGIAHRFIAVRTKDHVVNTKPAPDLFAAAAKALDVDPKCSVVVEDSRHGCRAAKLAGMTCVVVPNRITAHDLPADADLILDSLTDFPYANFALS